MSTYKYIFLFKIKSFFSFYFILYSYFSDADDNYDNLQ